MAIPSPPERMREARRPDLPYGAPEIGAPSFLCMSSTCATGRARRASETLPPNVGRVNASLETLADDLRAGSG
jgi:hypothetical protein